MSIVIFPRNSTGFFAQEWEESRSERNTLASSRCLQQEGNLYCHSLFTYNYTPCSPTLTKKYIHIVKKINEFLRFTIILIQLLVIMSVLETQVTNNNSSPGLCNFVTVAYPKKSQCKKKIMAIYIPQHGINT